MLQKINKRLESQGILIDIDESVKKYIVSKNSDKNYGARPLRREIQKIVEDSITDAIIDGVIKTNVRKKMIEKEGKIIFE